MYTSTPPVSSSSPYTSNYYMQGGSPSSRPANTPTDSIPPKTAASLKRHSNDPILWFANPPVNVEPLSSMPVHSVAYLKYKEGKP